MRTAGLSPVEEDMLVWLLKKVLAGGVLSNEVFTQLARLIPLSFVELVCLRKTNANGTELLAFPRPDGDPIWSGKIHSPGSGIRQADYPERIGFWNKEVLSAVFTRLQLRELGFELTSEPTFAGFSLQRSERGCEHVIVFWVEVPENQVLQNGGEWYPVEEFFTMSNTISIQYEAIRIAVDAYNRS